ncbi:hypothetical protein F5883DRAFT_145286 [Diaporthe sp. PMI_573]|nr:hypothetical protein F5883DRAFT_145286 [Diaporthaceae sp. PMI_573]
MMDLDSLSPWLVGVVKAPISCLAFPKSLNNGRLPKEYNIMQKERLFRNIGCHPHILRNQILADIDHATYKKLQSVLAGSLSSPDPPTTLPISIKLRCQGGQQRAKAAERVLGPDFQWTVRLYCCQVEEEHSRFHSTFRNVANSYSFEAPYTGGEVYRQIQLNPDAAENRSKGMAEPYQQEEFNNIAAELNRPTTEFDKSKTLGEHAC